MASRAKSRPTGLRLGTEFGGILVSPDMADDVCKRVAGLLKKDIPWVYINFQGVVVLTPSFIERAFFNDIALIAHGVDLKTFIISRYRFSGADESMMYLINKERKKFMEKLKGYR